MKLKIKNAPFTIKNNFYSYQTLSKELISLKKGKYYVIVQFNGISELINFDKRELLANQFIELICLKNQSIKLKSGSGVLLEKEIVDKQIEIGCQSISSIQDKAYFVNKPWGYEYWITGSSPVNDVVLKYIHIKKGTKTSLQVHKFKYESNYLVQGEAILRYSEETFSEKKEYLILEKKVNSSTVIDVEPLGIHQLESKSDIYLLEASTNHLDDVIRLKDDSGRGDGKIESEHKAN